MSDMKTLLIIDDVDANINMLMELLEDKYDILATLSGKDALEILEDEKVDLILLDVVMPKMDGFEVCKELKNNPKTKDIPVIFITANSDEAFIDKVYEIGGIDYLPKPFRAREVLSRISNHLLLEEFKQKNS